MNKSYLTAAVVAVAITLWVSAGVFLGEDSSPEQIRVQQNPGQPGITVEATPMHARMTTSFIIAQGSAMSDRAVTLTAETAGQIRRVLQTEGASVKEGDEILQLKLDDREIRREQARLKLLEQNNQFKALTNLSERGYASATEMDTAAVDVKIAEAELAKIDLEIAKTTISAPFDGIIEEYIVDVGDSVGLASGLVTLVSNNPLVVNIHVTQQDIRYLATSTEVRVQMIDGQEKSGLIRFISPRANEATRTYRVEIAIPNDEGLRAGSSVTAYVPKQQVMAHFVSPGLLTLNTAGEIGVKTVDQEGLVAFYPVTIVLSEPDGMWVEGLPDKANIITAGQGFAPVGGKVTVSLLKNDSIGIPAASRNSTEEVNLEHLN